MSKLAIPYPPVFHDWRRRHLDIDRRVATYLANGGVVLEMHDRDVIGKFGWLPIELTEDDASLLAASLLEKAGHRKLAKRVVKKLNKEAKR